MIRLTFIFLSRSLMKKLSLLEKIWKIVGTGKYQLNPIDFKEIVNDRLVLLALGNQELPRLVKDFGARDVLALESQCEAGVHRADGYTRKRYRRIPDIRKSNSQVAILHGISAYGLLQKRQFANFDYILIPTGFESVALKLARLRYEQRKILCLEGITSVADAHSKKEYWVLTANVQMPNKCRLYAPSHQSPLEIAQSLSGLNHVILRSSIMIEAGDHTGDIDVLISQYDVAACKKKFQEQAGTYPVDVYTELGQDGYSYKNVPYYSSRLSASLLESAVTTSANIRIPSPKWQFISFCYDLLFHDKLKPSASTENLLSPCVFKRHKHYDELIRLAEATNFLMPKKVNDLEKVLCLENVMPSIDLIGFYSNQNEFLSSRYFKHAQLKPGLATFFIRDFGGSLERLPLLRQRLHEQFEILGEGSIDMNNSEDVISGIRGGNWVDKTAPGGEAKPIYWFVCWDPSPANPSAKTRRKHPRVDNENIRIKDALRMELSPPGQKGRRIIHSSDNSFEAAEHIKILGLDNQANIVQRMKEI